MAIISCNECGEKVSDKAGSCPHCGAPIKLDEIYSEEEKEIVMVKASKVFGILICIILFLVWGFFGWIIWILVHTIISLTYTIIYSIVLAIMCISQICYARYIFKNSYIKLTNKRITGQIARLFVKDEVNYPLRQIKDISSFEIFGISLFKISTGDQWIQIPFAINGKKFKKEYFDLIENKYKYN